MKLSVKGASTIWTLSLGMLLMAAPARAVQNICPSCALVECRVALNDAGRTRPQMDVAVPSETPEGADQGPRSWAM